MIRKDLSDDEYVAMIRTRDRRIRRLQWLWPVIFIAMVGGLIWAAYLPHRIGKILEGEMAPALAWATAKMEFWGFLNGIMCGIIAVQAACFLKRWFDARSGYRTERLLLRYYDRSRDNAARSGR